jgi:hypothetical protein
VGELESLTPEEHAEFTQWADQLHSGRFTSLALHIPYGQAHPNVTVQLPSGCAYNAFVHMGYGDLAEPRDAYGTWGPVIAPERLSATVSNLRTNGYDGFSAYSEGVHDDLNKAILAGLASGQYSDLSEVLQAYAERYFGASHAEIALWAEWFHQWGSPFTVDIAAAQAEFASLAATARPSWRLAQWECRLRLYADHFAGMAQTATSTERIAAAQRFTQTRQYLYRDIWKLGLVRHVINPQAFAQPQWVRDAITLDQRVLPDEA